MAGAVAGAAGNVPGGDAHKRDDLVKVPIPVTKGGSRAMKEFGRVGFFDQTSYTGPYFVKQYLRATLEAWRDVREKLEVMPMKGPL